MASNAAAESSTPTTVLPLSHQKKTANNGFRRRIITGRGPAIIVLSILTSLIFISTISIAFVGGNSDDHIFVEALNDVVRFNPGIVLVGEDVDVDVDEPSVTIRWSLMACGPGVVLPGSTGLMGNDACGLPIEALEVFVNNDLVPSGKYDPDLISLDERTGRRKGGESATKFENSYVLDVHLARQYPFDRYTLESDLRIVSPKTNRSLPISRALTTRTVPSFNIDTADFRGLVMSSGRWDSNAQRVPSQHIVMDIRRPVSARLFTLVLFAISWVLTHISMGQLVIARRGAQIGTLACFLIISTVTLVILPQIRHSMPDAPGLNGVLIDCIGFFPQMVIVGLCVIILVLLLAVRELDSWKGGPNEAYFPSSTRPVRPQRPPQSLHFGPNADMAQWERKRTMRHLRGDYVFPPVSIEGADRSKPAWKPAHRRNKTTRTVMTTVEDGEISRWSDNEDE